MAEETENHMNIWNIAGVVVPLILLGWAWLVYQATASGPMVAVHYRIGEDALWLFSAFGLVYLNFQLMKLSEGGLLERGFLAFMAAFSIILVWKYFVVVMTFNTYVNHSLEHTAEILQGVSGIVMGVAFIYMYNLMRPKG